MKSFKADSNSRYIQSIDLPAGNYTFSAIVRSPNMRYSFAIEEIGGWRTFDLNLHTTEFKKVSIQFLTAKVTKINLVSNYASPSNVIEIVSPMLNGGTIASPAKRHELDLTESITSQEIFTQYSVDGSSNWHDTYVAGDRYMRTKKGEGNWSAPMLFVGEDGAKGADGKYTEIEFAKNTSTTTAPTSGWQDAPPTASEGEYVWMRQGEVIPPATTPSAWSPAVRLTGIPGAQGLQGLQGEKGDQGIPGTNGANGQTSYFHIKYSPVSNPTDAQMTETPDVYIGTYVDFNPTDSTLASSYKWSRFQGVKGDQGIPGNNGADGQTYYLHIAYADNASGGGFSQDPTGKSYIGTYTDTIATDASAGDAKWKWVKFVGTNGTNGVSVTSVVIQYAKSTSATDAPTSGWGTTRPVWESGTYLWQRTFTTYSDSTTSAGTASLDNTWQADGKIVELENKTNFLTGTTIEGNAVATGTLLVGDGNGTNAMICGITDQPNGESIRFAAGKPYAQKYLSPFQVLDNGMVRFVNPVTGQKTFELGYNQATGKVVFDIYDENGVKIATIGSKGIMFTGYIQESFDTQYFTKLDTNTFEESAIINSFKTTLRKRIVTNGPPRVYAIYMVSNKTAYLYDAGRNFETASNDQYIGYHNTANKFDSFIDDGIYMVMAPEELFDQSETVYYSTTAYKMVNGKVNDAMYVTVEASLTEITSG